MPGPIRLDRSTSSGIVIVCTLCPWWAAFRFGTRAAEDAACDHEERVHPSLRHRREAREKAEQRRRHADRS